MKKALCLVFCLLSVFSFAACKKKGNTQKNQNSSSSESSYNSSKVYSQTILQCRKQVLQLKKIKAPLPELRKAQKARVNQAPRIKTAVTAVILPSALSLMKFRISPEFTDYFKTQIQNQEFLSRFSKFQRLFCHRKSRFFLPLCMPLIFRKRK